MFAVFVKGITGKYVLYTGATNAVRRGVSTANESKGCGDRFGHFGFRGTCRAGGGATDRSGRGAVGQAIELVMTARGLVSATRAAAAAAKRARPLFVHGASPVRTGRGGTRETPAPPVAIQGLHTDQGAIRMTEVGMTVVGMTVVGMTIGEIAIAKLPPGPCRIAFQWVGSPLTDPEIPNFTSNVDIRDGDFQAAIAVIRDRGGAYLKDGAGRSWFCRGRRPQFVSSHPPNDAALGA